MAPSERDMGGIIRIRGLVRYLNRVRAALQTGIPESEIDAFRNRVRATIHQVEELCRRYDIGLDELPGPSRSAYRFLKELDLNDLPVLPAGRPAAGARVIRLKNVRYVARHLGRRMWERLPALIGSTSELSRLQEEIGRQAAGIERICTLAQGTPSLLAASSRQLYCWLKFLSSDGSLAVHLAGLMQAREAGSAVPAALGPPMEVHLLHLGSLWRSGWDRERTLLRVSEGFVAADAAVWRAIVRGSTGKGDRAGDLLIREFSETEEFSEVLTEIESFAEPPSDSTRGRAHELKDSFERVNRDYFAGRMAMPRLTWSRALTISKLGHYRFSADTVMISVSLDDPRLPAVLVDFVMYHELLHKHHGAVTVNGRRLVHTAQFRADERRFVGYEQVKRQLEEVAHRYWRTGRRR